MHQKISKRAQAYEKGFTLIEVLVTVSLVAVLAAIAIARYQNYRKKGYDAAAQQDLHSILTAEEAYYLDNDVYLAFSDTVPPAMQNYGLVLSPTTQYFIINTSNNDQWFSAETSAGINGNCNYGNGDTYQWANGAFTVCVGCQSYLPDC